MERQKKRKKLKLKTKLLIAFICFALLNMIVISLVVGIYYFIAEIKEDWEAASAMVRAASSYIDGDRVLCYLEPVGTGETGETVYYTDEYYDQVMEYLTAAQKEFDLVEYFYIFVPRGEECVYVWDAVSANQYSPRGSVSVLDEDEKRAIDSAFSREPKGELLASEDVVWGNVLSTFYPIFDGNGDPVALVGIDLSLDDVMHEILLYLMLILGAILLVTVVFVIILFGIIKRILLRPIGKLNEAAKNIVTELTQEQPFDLDIRTGDEIEELADSFRKMDGDLRAYLGQLTAVTADQERIHAEYNVAKQLQADILPNEFPAFPERNDFDIYASILPSAEIGGDFYDFFLVDDDHLAMVMGDVAGQGVSAALYMVIVETLIKSRTMQGLTPAEVLQSVSEQMLDYRTELFSMIWFAVLELSTGRGIAANAGHEHPILCRAGGEYQLQEYRHDPPVGAVEGTRFRDHGFQLRPGDSLFIYSDGVKDAFNEKGENFGTQRLLETLNRESEATPSVIVQTVKQSVSRFSGDRLLSDDLTVLAFKYYGPGGGTDRI